MTYIAPLPIVISASGDAEADPGLSGIGEGRMGHAVQGDGGRKRRRPF